MKREALRRGEEDTRKDTKEEKEERVGKAEEDRVEEEEGEEVGVKRLDICDSINDSKLFCF
jgi:hypothetical protein